MTTHGSYGQDAQDETAEFVRSLALSSAKLWEALFERVRRIEVAQAELYQFLTSMQAALPAAVREHELEAGTETSTPSLPTAATAADLALLGTLEEAAREAAEWASPFAGLPSQGSPDAGSPDERSPDEPIAAAVGWAAPEPSPATLDEVPPESEPAPAPPIAWVTPAFDQENGNGSDTAYTALDRAAADLEGPAFRPPPPPAVAPAPPQFVEATVAVPPDAPLVAPHVGLSAEEPPSSMLWPPPPPPPGFTASVSPSLTGDESAVPAVAVTSPPPPPPGFAPFGGPAPEVPSAFSPTGPEAAFDFTGFGAPASDAIPPPPPPPGFASAPPPPPGFATFEPAPPPPPGFATFEPAPPPPPGFATFEPAPASAPEAPVFSLSEPEAGIDAPDPGSPPSDILPEPPPGFASSPPPEFASTAPSFFAAHAAPAPHAGFTGNGPSGPEHAASPSSGNDAGGVRFDGTEHGDNPHPPPITPDFFARAGRRRH